MVEGSTVVGERSDLVVTESTVSVGDTEVKLQSAGEGRPLLVLHDELGFPGWLRWTRQLAAHRQLLVPIQPGFGWTERVDWVRDYRDLACFYLRMVRQLSLGPVDVLGFSAGGFIAAEMTAASPESIDRLILSAPLGLRPAVGEIFDFLAVTARAHLAATTTNTEGPEIGVMYGGEMTSELFELFEAARAETCRLGWEPFMYSPSLGERLKGVDGVPALIIWGDDDRIVPVESMRAYAEALKGARLEILPGCGHRPEIEATSSFVELLTTFLITDEVS